MMYDLFTFMAALKWQPQITASVPQWPNRRSYVAARKAARKDRRIRRRR